MTYLPDLMVLFLFALFLGSPALSLRYLSLQCLGPSPLSSDPLAGALSGVSVGLFLGYLLLTWLPASPSSARLKNVLIILFTVIALMVPTCSDILARRDLGLTDQAGRTISLAHDGGVLQTEAAMEFLLQGKSPYQADYSQTAMAQGRDSQPALWQYYGFKENPAFHYFPYPPAILLLSLPFYLASKSLLGWYDQRLVAILALFLLGLFTTLLAKPDERRPLFLAIIVLNPLLARFFQMGMNDVYYITGLFFTILLLQKKQIRSAAFALGLACGLKQFAWLVIPFFGAYVWSQCHQNDGQAERFTAILGRFMGRIWPGILALGLIFGPFLIWDKTGLIHSLLLAQNSEYPFRAAGLGLSNFLIFFGWVHSFGDPFPFWIAYGVVILPLVGYGIRQVSRLGSLSAMLSFSALTLLLFLFFSRHFAPNYLWGILTLLTAAGMLRQENESSLMGEPDEMRDCSRRK
jgi:hypothetical protein